MRTARKLSSKNLRAASSPSAFARTARPHTACSAAYIGRASSGGWGGRAIGRQVGTNVAKATACWSLRQPSTSAHATGSSRASRIRNGLGTSGTEEMGGRSLPVPWCHFGAARCRGAAAAGLLAAQRADAKKTARISTAATRGEAPSPREMTEGAPPPRLRRIHDVGICVGGVLKSRAPELCALAHVLVGEPMTSPSGHALVARLDRHALPVAITRGYIACER